MYSRAVPNLSCLDSLRDRRLKQQKKRRLPGARQIVSLATSSPGSIPQCNDNPVIGKFQLELHDYPKVVKKCHQDEGQQFNGSFLAPRSGKRLQEAFNKHKDVGHQAKQHRYSGDPPGSSTELGKAKRALAQSCPIDPLVPGLLSYQDNVETY